AWQSRYLAACEYLLFNIPGSLKLKRQVVSAWGADWRPSLRIFLTVTVYLWIANVCRSHVYLLLRIARRLAMQILPSVYFAQSSALEHSPVPESTFRLLRDRLQASHQE
ncbi:MAG: hypothetical protein ACK48Y_24920, partial [Planctomyces sp.]